MEFLQSEIERVAQELALRLVQLLAFGACPPQPSVGPMSDGRDHVQIAQQFLEVRGGCGLGLNFLLHLQKQLGLFQKALSDLRRRLSPSGIQLPRLPARELVSGKGTCHLLAVLQAVTRHRHQVLHRQLRRDLARAYLLLHVVRKKLH
jgi:hypothetical protein